MEEVLPPRHMDGAVEVRRGRISERRPSLADIVGMRSLYSCSQ